MGTSTQTFLYLFSKPEYFVLLISILAVIVSAISVGINVYISYRNRKYALAKEEYFRLQNKAERIISKLLILEKQRLKLKHFFELSYKASKDKNILFFDANDTFNKADFEKDNEEIATFIYLYFNMLGDKWNTCMDKMSELFTHVFILHKKIEDGGNFNWKEEAETYNKVSQELGNQPNEIAEELKKELKKFKKNNL